MKFKSVIFIILTIGAFIFSCETEEKKTFKKFIVMGSGGSTGIYGYYVVDGGDIQNFSVAAPTNGFYKFEQDLETPETVFIFASGYDETLSSLNFLIYDDTDLLKNPYATRTDYQDILSLSHYYDFSTSTSASASP